MSTLTQTSPTRLELRSRPSVWLLTLLWLALFAYLALVMPADQLRLQRGANGVVDVNVETRLLGVTLGGHWTRGVTKAELQFPPPDSVHQRRRRGSTVHVEDTARIALETARGWVPVSRSYVAGSAAQDAVVTQVNDFLADPQSTRAMAVVPRSAWLYVGLAILLLAALGATFGAWCRCEIDRESDLVRITWASIPKSQSVEYRLSEVERFQVLQTAVPLTSNRGRGRFQYTVVMRLQDGLETSVTRQYTSGTSAAMHDLARRLEKFRTGA
ncbi:MAG: hypothetical protein JNK85_06860 [Verrucomicrobiales bacterium]|nr:hypothetical protein [Verrucomicrobiales bacterium]